MPRVERIRRHYETRVSPERESYDILDWADRESQLCRFDVFRTIVDSCGLAPGFSVLDVGCGMTDLASYLEDSGRHATYIGVDITYALLAEVRRRSPTRRILQADVFAAPPFRSGSVDATYCSGVFNLQLGNNEAFALQALPQLARLSRRVAVANFLHQRTVQKYDHCYYFDPDCIVTAMEKQGLAVEIIDDYLENDFTVVLRQPQVPTTDGLTLKPGL